MGNIGSYFCNEIVKKKKDILLKTGINLNLLYVSAKNKNKKRPFKFKNKQWIHQPLNITNDPAVDIIVELIGGSEGLAKKVVISALKNKKHVITANKALIAKHGNYISYLAEKNKVNFEYEASVASGIPIIRCIKEGLISNKISKLIGILNGTSNYILCRMEWTGKNFNEILKEAIKFGYKNKYEFNTFYNFSNYKYDIIIDANIKSFACCEKAFQNLMQQYFDILNFE